MFEYSNIFLNVLSFEAETKPSYLLYLIWKYILKSSWVTGIQIPQKLSHLRYKLTQKGICKYSFYFISGKSFKIVPNMFSPTSPETFWLEFAFWNSYLGSFNGKWYMEPLLPQSPTTPSVCVMSKITKQASSSITAFSFGRLIHKCLELTPCKMLCLEMRELKGWSIPLTILEYRFWRVITHGDK